MSELESCDTSIQLNFNLKKLVENLEFAFRDKITFWQELLQNSRRAGASKINIVENDDYVEITDNGHGIKNMSQMFLKSTSDWTSDGIEKEKPYGMGFLSVLYQSKRVVIKSNHYCLDAMTDDILSLKEIPITKMSKGINGTEIKLFGVKEVFPKFEFRGFPIPITINGHEVERGHAKNCKEIKWDKTEFGYISMPEIGKIREFPSIIVYLQGICVESCYPEPKDGRLLIIHLDEEKYIGSWPDRSNLLNHGTEMQNLRYTCIPSYCKLLLINHFMEHKDSSPELLCDLFKVYRDYGLTSLFDQLDIIPASCLFKVKDYPLNRGYMLSEGTKFYENSKRHISKKDVKSGKVNLFDTPLEVSPTTFNNLMYLFMSKGENYIVDEILNCQNHWVSENLKLSSFDSVDVELVGEINVSKEKNKPFQADFKLCEGIVFIGPDDSRTNICRLSCFLEINYKDYVVVTNSDYTNFCKQSEVFINKNGMHDWGLSAHKKFMSNLSKWYSRINEKGGVVALYRSLFPKELPELRNREITISIDQNGKLNFKTS